MNRRAEDWKERFAAVNAYIRTQIHIDLAGKIPEGVDLPTELGLDGIHLDPPGKKLMAEAVNEQWEKVLAQFAEKIVAGGALAGDFPHREMILIVYTIL